MRYPSIAFGDASFLKLMMVTVPGEDESGSSESVDSRDARLSTSLSNINARSLSTGQKQLRMRYLELLDSIDQAIEEIRELLNEVHSVLSQGSDSTLSPYSIVSLASIIKDIKKVCSSSLSRDLVILTMPVL